MSNRTLLIVALVLMAGGLLLGGIDLVAGGGATPVENQQPFGPNGQQGQQGPEGGFRPGQPGVGETEPGEASRKRSPLPTIPRPTPKATPTP